MLQRCSPARTAALSSPASAEPRKQPSRTSSSGQIKLSLYRTEVLINNSDRDCREERSRDWQQSAFLLLLRPLLFLHGSAFRRLWTDGQKRGQQSPSLETQYRRLNLFLFYCLFVCLFVCLNLTLRLMISSRIGAMIVDDRSVFMSRRLLGDIRGSANPPLPRLRLRFLTDRVRCCLLSFQQAAAGSCRWVPILGAEGTRIVPACSS